MLRSIRSTFLLWLSLILIAVIGGFGTSLYYLVRRAKVQEVDAELDGAVQLVAANLRRGRPGRPRPLDDGPFERLLRRFPLGVPTGISPREGEPRGERERPLPEPDWGPDRALRGFGPRPGPGEGRPGEAPVIPTSLLTPPEEDAGDSAYLVVWSADGEVFEEASMPAGLRAPEGLEEGKIFRRQQGDNRESALLLARGFVVLAGKPMQREFAELHRYVGITLATGSVVLLVGLAGGWLLVRRALRPIQAISGTAESISASNLSRRIDVESTQSELGGLANVLNTTFERLERAFEEQARFTADASHELRTPVAAILAQTAMARRRERTAEEYRQVIDECYCAAERMKALVDGLLALSRSDSGALSLDIREFALEEAVEGCTSLVESLATEHAVTIDRHLEHVTVEGDLQGIGQVVSNLLTNAIRHNRPGGEVRVRLEGTDVEAIISVADTGVGISQEHLPRIFDRFFRVDAARSSTGGGVGLGLAIAKAFVEAHRGTISCESTPEVGSTFTVRIPRRYHL